MKQEKTIFNLESHHLSDDELQALLECLDTGEDQAEEDDDDSDEIDPFSGIPINSKMGYEPYRAPKQISIRKCSRCHSTFDSFVGIESSICNKCRLKLGYPLIPEATDMQDAMRKEKKQKWHSGTQTLASEHVTRKKREMKETILPVSSQSNFTDDELFSMLSHVGKKKH